jgi:hypothetical protein
LKQQLQELEIKNNQNASDIEYLTKLAEKLQMNTPDVADIVSTVLTKERQEVERKNQKVLEILKDKDEKIDRLHKELTLAQSRIKDLKEQVKQSKLSLQSLETKYQQVRIRRTLANQSGYICH